MRNKYLLGATENHEIVFAELRIIRRNGYPQFCASFYNVKPLVAEKFDAQKYYADWISDVEIYGGDEKDLLYDLCRRYNCPPEDLSERLAEGVADIRDVIDCSVYPELIEADGHIWCFEARACGQHDTRGEMEEIINPTLYDEIHDLWDEYHLKRIEEDIIGRVENLEKQLSQIDKENWIADYIGRHKYELERNEVQI